MKFVFVLAGVPQEIFDEVRKERDYIAGGDNTEVDLVHHGRYGTPYGPTTVNDIIGKCLPRLKAEAEEDLGQIGFAVLYIRNGNSDRVIEEGLFPFLFQVPIDWHLTGYDKHGLRTSKNALVRPLRELGARIRICLQTLGTELVEQAQRTPWLLPVRNFESPHLCPAIHQLQADLLAAPKPQEVLARRGREFRQRHPPRRPQEGHHAGRSYFVDESGMSFQPPGKDLHGFFRPAPGHTQACNVSSRRRLGAPYRRAFHYDCTRGGGATSASLFSCHRHVRALVKSSKNINIATNDFTRPDAENENGP